MAEYLDSDHPALTGLHIEPNGGADGAFFAKPREARRWCGYPPCGGNLNRHGSLQAL